MNELPEEIATALQKYIKLRSEILALEHETHAYAVGGQCELEAKCLIRLEHMEKMQDEAREKLNALINMRRVSSEDIVKALY